MKTAYLLIVMLGCGMTAKADFSYSQTRKSSQAMTAAGGEATTKHFLKGQKMKVDSGKTASIFDFDAQTVTVLDNQQKTYTVTPFGELGKGLPQTGMNANVDVKETGQKKVVNGFNASEVVMTIAMQSGQQRYAGNHDVGGDGYVDL